MQVLTTAHFMLHVAPRGSTCMQVLTTAHAMLHVAPRVAPLPLGLGSP